ncbi:protein of unknown function DUF547 [Dillenia turbinata]|uniref:DUF547 domain-containing protein n=1 Tax=Dillenia turbinata TaxID=194707 RepID=A0AAN8W0F3_9MAGN
MGEIAELEVEIIQLERFLLSLYQKAFGQHVPTLAEYSGTHLQCQIGMGLQATSSPSCWDSTKSSDGRTAASPTALPAMNIPFKLQNFVYGEHLRDLKNPDLSRCKLADYFGADPSDVSCTVQIDSAVKFSEDMISCMSSIYCQLAEPPLAHGGHLASPMSSLSSSSTFSTQKHNDSWSPQCSEETTVHCRLLAFNEENGPYNAMLEVTEIHLNDERFKYASKMLQTFRLTAYSYQIVKPSPWIKTLSLSRRKSKPGGVKHVYAIENPEPLVHFALCLGAFSDPAVRKYTANNMVEDLRLAR